MHFYHFIDMVLFIDCQIAGISGDMILSSLVDIGANKSKIIDGVKDSANFLQGSTIKKLDFVKVQKKGKSATQLVLEIDEDTHERKGTEIKNCILSSCEKLGLSNPAKEFAENSINTLINAESNVHGEPESSVHFHEASSIDTVVDIIGTAIALDDLNLFEEEISCSHVAIGGGTVSFSHGVTSNPAYAITEIFKNSKIVVTGGPVTDELTTPTGASILVNLASSCKEFFVDMSIDSVGYGAGTKNFDDFAHEFVRFCINESKIMTFSGYVDSLKSDIYDSYLAFDVLPATVDGSDKRKIDFLKDKNYFVYEYAARQAGFSIDPNKPWRLIVNLNSKPIVDIMKKKYFQNHYLFHIHQQYL